MSANSIFSGPMSNKFTFNIVFTEIFSDHDAKARTKKKKKRKDFTFSIIIVRFQVTSVVVVKESKTTAYSLA